MTLFLLLIDWDSLRPEKIFGQQVLERTPAGLTIFYTIGLGILIGLLFVTFLDDFRKPKFIFERSLPRRVAKRLTQAAANHSLRIWMGFFFVLSVTVLGFQVYWTYFADESNEQFQ